jgi:hypothetical protein
MLGHSLLWLQSTSQLHDAAQSTDGHAAAPEQRTAHEPAPQFRLPHDAEPRQATSQLLPLAQSIVPHAPLALQRIVQS